MTEEKILDRIQKLLALGQSGNPHEAASAMSKAKALMDEHRLSSSDLDRAAINHVDVRSRFSVSKPKNYELAVVQLVGKAFGGAVMWKSSASWMAKVENSKAAYGCYTIIAPKIALPVALWMADYLVERLAKARAEYTATLPPFLARANKIQMADGFCLGWARSVAFKLKALINDQPDRREAIESYIKKTINSDFGTDAAKDAKMDARRGSALGALAGMEKGAQESIHRPIDGGGSKPLRLS